MNYFTNSSKKYVEQSIYGTTVLYEYIILDTLPHIFLFSINNREFIPWYLINTATIKADKN